MNVEVPYRIKYPDYCKSCLGWGVVSFTQSHPYGSTTASETLSEPCETCVGNGLCPRCMKPVQCQPDYGDLVLPCPHCGWNNDDGEVEEDVVEPF